MQGLSFLFLLLGLLGVTLIALLVLPESALPFNLEKDEFAQVATLSILALAIASGFTVRNIKLTKTLRDTGIWVALFLVFVIGYTLRDDLKPLWQRVQAALLPGHAISSAEGSVEIARASSGAFQVRSEVNNVAISFLLDTGASTVVLTAEDAERAGFVLERLSFFIPVDTANGSTQAAPIRIGEIKVGSIVRENVRGLVAQPDNLSTSLLGMTFLNQLGGFSVEGDRLILRD